MTSQTTSQPATDINETDLMSAFGASSTRLVDNSTVFISPERRQAFAHLANHFAGLPVTSKREFVLATEADADLMRLQIRQFARENNLICGFPTESKDHRQLNAGCVVTFRIAPRRADDDADAEEVATVTDAADAETVARTALAAVK